MLLVVRLESGVAESGVLELSGWEECVVTGDGRREAGWSGQNNPQ